MVDGSNQSASAREVGYRQRLYDAYVRASGAELCVAPTEIATRRAYLQRVIAVHFPPDRDCRVLDLGCGSGLLLHFAVEAGYNRVRGVDRSPEQIALARSLELDCVEQADAIEYVKAVPSASLDVVTAFDVLEHLTKPEAVEFLDSVSRALAERGRLILHVPNAESPFSGAIRYGDFTHEQAFTRQTMLQLATITNFQSVACFEDVPVPHGLKSAVRWALWPLARLALRLFSAIETGATGSDAVLTRNMLVVMRK